jgi:hypothetical protein
VVNADHLPERPTWECKSCGDQWPCGPAREGLLGEYATDPVALAIRMWGHLEDYSMDAGAGPLQGAWNRFLSWTRRGPGTRSRGRSCRPGRGSIGG